MQTAVRLVINRAGCRSAIIAVLLPNTGLPENYALTASENHATASGLAWSPQHGSGDISISKRPYTLTSGLPTLAVADE